MKQSGADSRPSEARARLLATASQIFYTEGIHSVGIDRIVGEAQVTRATLYRHFPGKEELVVTYLTEADQAIRARMEAAVAGAPTPADALRALARTIAEDIQSPGFRGCAFLNAVAEYPDPEHPVHKAVLAHRQWFLDTVTALLAHTHGPAAEEAGRHFVMLRDGAMAAGCLFNTALISETFVHAVEGLLQSPPASAAAHPAP